MKAFFKFSTVAVLLLALIGLVLLFGLGYSLYQNKGANLKFINASGQHLESVKVLVSGKQCSVSKLGPNGEFSCYFENLSDSSYAVTATSQSGKVYSVSSLGYVSGGMNFNDIITINQSGVIALESIPST